MLVKEKSMRFVNDVKVICVEEVTTEHREMKKPSILGHKIWKLKEAEVM